MRFRSPTISEKDWPNSTELRTPIDYMWDVTGKRVRGRIVAMDTELGDVLLLKEHGATNLAHEPRLVREIAHFDGPLELATAGYMVGKSPHALPKP